MAEPLRANSTLKNNLWLRMLSEKASTLILLLLFLVVISSNSLQAQITSGENGEWSSAGTWTGASVPTAIDNVTVDHEVTVQSGTTAEANDLYIGQSGILIVEGTLIIYGNLTMVNNDPELIAGTDATIIIYGDAIISNKVNINLSSYFIVLGNFTINGGGATNIDISDASIYVFGTFDRGSTGLTICEDYDNNTDDYDNEECHVGTESAFNDNNDAGLIPDEIVDMVDPCTEPNVTNHPSASDTQYCEEEPANSLSITATGDGISYQWYMDDDTTPQEGDETPVGSGSQTYTPSTSTPGTLYYYCVVTGDCGTETSDVSGAITVYSTTITSGTVGGSSELELCEGGNPTAFSVGAPAGGDGNYTYQWEESDGCSGTWVNATAQDGISNTLSFNPPALNSTICYRLKITDGCGSVGYSDTKTYNVVPDPVSQTIEPVPASGTTVCVDESVSATFSGGNGGTGTVTDVYDFSTDGGSSWNNYTPGTEITATADMIGVDMIQVRTRRTATGSGCNYGDLNYVEWTVTPDNTVTLTSTSGTDNQTVNIETNITTIAYTTTGATGADFSGLPAGISGNWASNEVTISGTPTETGTFNYTIELTGGCGTVTATGTINVNNTFDVSTESPGQICNAADGQINYTETDVATPITFTVDMTTGNTAWSPDWEITFTLTPGPGTSIDNIITSAGSFTTPGPFRITNIPSTEGVGTVQITLEVTGNIYSDLTVLFEITAAKELQHDTPDKDNDDRIATQTVLAIPNTGEITTN